MECSKTALRLASSVCLVALAACSGGGGGGISPNVATNNMPAGTTGDTSSNTNSSSGNTSSNNSSGGTSSNNNSGSTSSSNTSGNTSSNTTTTPSVSIGAPDKPNVSIQAASFNFTTNPPAVGSQIGFFGPAVKVTSTSVQAAGTDINSRIIYRGQVNNVPVFDLNIPTIGLTATNVHADSTTTTLADGGKVVLGIALLNYTAAGAWAYTPATGGAIYAGMAAAGSGTPIANVPTSGSATYIGKGAVGGLYFVPSGTGVVSTGSLSGDVSLTANFASGGVTGSLSNMTATPGLGGAATPWNTVSLSASINRLPNNASFIGTTGTANAPAGAGITGFSSAATGGLGGAFFGPNAEEVGGTWTLTEPNAAGGGKTAFGAFGAAK